MSCQKPTTQIDYTIHSISPTPARPGELVTIYGTLPQADIYLLGQKIPALKTDQGLQIKIPQTLPAGIHLLQVGSYTTLQTSIQILPILNKVELQANTLHIQGYGWRKDSFPTIILNRQVLTPKKVSNGQLEVILPVSMRQRFGTLDIQVTVANQLSNRQQLTYSASAVRGSLTTSEQQQEHPFFLEETPHNLLHHNYAKPSDNVLTIIHWDDLSEISSQTGALQYDTWLLPDTLRHKIVGNTLRSRRQQSLNSTCLRFPDASQTNIFLQSLQHDPLKILSIERGSSLQINDGAESIPAIPVNQWHLAKLDIRAAWRINQGQNITVAVLDSGVDLQHPALKNNILPGYDFINLAPNAQDSAGHGTHVAGLIAAQGAVMGIAPKAKILPIKVLGDQAGGTPCDAARGILWAVDALPGLKNPNPAHILNLSLGTDSYNTLLKNAIDIAYEKKAIIVAATGNKGGAVAYPAAFDNVIAVTALAGPKRSYQPWYANKGWATTLTAYGGDISQDQDRDGIKDGILSTEINGYGYRMGTSMASPQVAGLLALLLSEGITQQNIVDVLLSTAQDLGIKGRDKRFGYGLANAQGLFSQHNLVAVAKVGDEIISWQPLNTKEKFYLNHLPSTTPIEISILSDKNKDGLYGGTGEYESNKITVTLTIGEVRDMDPLILHAAQGQGIQLPHFLTPSPQ